MRTCGSYVLNKGAWPNARSYDHSYVAQLKKAYTFWRAWESNVDMEILTNSRILELWTSTWVFRYLCSLVPRPLPVFQCYTQKNGRAWPGTGTRLHVIDVTPVSEIIDVGGSVCDGYREHILTHVLMPVFLHGSGLGTRLRSKFDYAFMREMHLTASVRPTKQYALISDMRLTTRKYGICIKYPSTILTFSPVMAKGTLNHCSKVLHDLKIVGSRKLSRAHISSRLFWRGVPVRSSRWGAW